MKLGVCLLAFAFLISGCAHFKNASYKKSNPIVLNFDIAPGYANSISQSIQDDSDIHASVLVLKPKPVGPWKSNANFALLSKDSSQYYIFHILVDTLENRIYAKMKLISENGKLISERTTPLLYKQRGVKYVRFARKENHLTVYLNEVPIDEVILPFQPVTLEIGASSGAFKIRLIEQPPIPYKQ